MHCILAGELTWGHAPLLHCRIIGNAIELRVRHHAYGSMEQRVILGQRRSTRAHHARSAYYKSA